MGELKKYDMGIEEGYESGRTWYLNDIKKKIVELKNAKAYTEKWNLLDKEIQKQLNHDVEQKIETLETLLKMVTEEFDRYFLKHLGRE